MSKSALKIGMKPPHPGNFVRDEVLEPLGLSITRAAEVLGVRRATLSDFVNGKSAASPELTLRIERAFGINMETLLRMQAWYDTCVMREKAEEIGVEPYRAKPAA